MAKHLHSRTVLIVLRLCRGRVLSLSHPLRLAYRANR
jgi:hypothetical protein